MLAVAFWCPVAARYVLLAGDLKAFADEGDEVVAHGGIALEEVMVPFVVITRDI
jgi:hypothetical protein